MSNETQMLILEKYAHFPLSVLQEDEAFYSDIMRTGVNKAHHLARRFSFMQPKLVFEVTGEYQELLNICLVNKLSGKKQYLYHIDRHVVLPQSDNPPVILINDEDAPLSEIEDKVGKLLGVVGYRLPDSVRYLSFKYLKKNPGDCTITLQLQLDTLTTKANLEVKLLINYLRVEDVLNATIRDKLEKGEEVSTLHRFNHLEPQVDQYGLAYSYRQRILTLQAEINRTGNPS